MQPLVEEKFLPTSLAGVDLSGVDARFHALSCLTQALPGTNYGGPDDSLGGYFTTNSTAIFVVG